MLAISGSLEVTIGDERIQIVADGQQLTAKIGGERDLRRSLIALARGRPMIRAFAARLNQNGLTLTIVRNGAPLARLGRDTRPSLVDRLLDLPHVTIFPRTPRA